MTGANSWNIWEIAMFIIGMLLFITDKIYFVRMIVYLLLQPPVDIWIRDDR